MSYNFLTRTTLGSFFEIVCGFSVDFYRMVLFTIIFFAMVIIVGAMSVIAFSFFLKRRTKRLQAQNPPQFDKPPPPYRSLFEPDEEELQTLEREETARLKSNETETAHRIAEEKISAVKDFEKVWREFPNTRNTVEFLRLAAESASSAVFAETAQKILQFRDDKKLNISARDLADLLDSHLRILPQQESTSGELFRLKEETAALRRKSEEV